MYASVTYFLYTGGNTFYSLTEGLKKTRVLSPTSALIAHRQQSPTPASSSRPTLDYSSLGITSNTTATAKKGSGSVNKRASDLDVSLYHSI